MKIATIGRGKIGGGLDLWERAGHEVTRIGHEGGDASEVDVVLVAVPGDAVEEALGGVTGLDGKTAIDATNLYGGAVPPAGHASNAEYVGMGPVLLPLRPRGTVLTHTPCPL
jgi:predicted dinucleotide-binding enzyme